MTGNELRSLYLDFFKSKEHLILPSAPLIPHQDPTLLLIGAGMAPFKPFFTGKMRPPKSRIATSQKCIRTGDIENVGRTARHHTFFEMLGNFSFGDYFKTEAIHWAWEFLTQKEYLNLPVERLWITIHTDDDEAFQIWNREVGVPAERIVRLQDNFWEIGPGPCGPCSEIYYDLGVERGCQSPDCTVGCDCDRYLEIWNLVFTQFDRDEEGNYTPLEKKNIDTGAGLERIASVLQNKLSNFETDLLFPLIEYTAQKSGTVYGHLPKTDVSLKVIADHARSMVMMIADGVLPSNEGRGYVLRRILRRAVRHGRLLGLDKPFLAELVDITGVILGTAYPDLLEKEGFLKSVIKQEEERFHTTLLQGMTLLSEHMEILKKENQSLLSGANAFKLYDTFGFPLELTQEILEEQGFSVDTKGFTAAMKAQQERARAARSDVTDMQVLPDISTLQGQQLREDIAVTQSTIVFLSRGADCIDKADAGEKVLLILKDTPFHPEGGGQIGDIGKIKTKTGEVEILNTAKMPDGTIYHTGLVLSGFVKVNDTAELFPAVLRRLSIARNHTATHLLHAALKKILGEHVNQAGSLVEEQRLRFDFSHFAAVTPQQLDAIEMFVNQAVLENRSLTISNTTQEEARKMGAIALFGEKYGEKVRVVQIDPYSMELCGGTHVHSTGEIGLFRITGEMSIGAGVRRIEAVTGLAALQYMYNREKILLSAADVLKTRPEEVIVKISNLQEQIHEIEKELASLHSKSSLEIVEKILSLRTKLGNMSVLIAEVPAKDMSALRSIADVVKQHVVDGFLLLGSRREGKVNLVAMASKKAISEGIHAGNLIKEISKLVGGGGGGRPDMAQAGGKEPENLTSALKKAEEIAATQLKN